MATTIKHSNKRVRLTTYQRNVMRAINRYVVRCLAKHFSKALRRDPTANMLMLTMSCPQPGPAKVQLDHFMAWLNTLSPPFKTIPPSNGVIGLVARCITAHCLDLDNDLGLIQKQVLSDMAKDASALEMQCLLPPPRRERQEGRPKPTTVVGKRAVRAADNLAKWERKLKFAENKVKKYSKAVRYYEKKGAI